MSEKLDLTAATRMTLGIEQPDCDNCRHYGERYNKGPRYQISRCHAPRGAKRP